MPDRHLYFAFGSNMDPTQMAERCPDHRAIGPATLAGFRLTFPRPSARWHGGGAAGIEPDRDARTRGVLYELSDDDLGQLDRCEGIASGRYRRLRVTVETDAGERREAWTYRANPEPGAPFPPHPDYLGALLAGARHHALGDDWIAMLEAVETHPTRTT